MFHEIASFADKNSRKLTLLLCEFIKEQSLAHSISNFQQKKLKNEIKVERERRHKTTLTRLQNRINDNEKCLNTITQEKGVSNWYQTSYTISDQGFNPSKQKFWDSLRKRYRWELTNIPFSYTCGSKIRIQYAMS